MADYPVTPHTPALSEQEIIRRQKLQARSKLRRLDVIRLPRMMVLTAYADILFQMVMSSGRRITRLRDIIRTILALFWQRDL